MPGVSRVEARVEEAGEIRTDASILPLPSAAHPHRRLFDRQTGASSHAPLAPRIIIYRSRYRQGCKNKTEGSVLSCLKRMPDDFTSIIETYIYIPLSHVAEQTTINIHFCVVSLPSTAEPRFYPFTLLSRFFLDDDNDSLTSKMREKREGEGGEGRKGIFGDALEEGKGGSVRSSSDLSARFSLFRLNACKIEE